MGLPSKKNLDYGEWTQRAFGAASGFLGLIGDVVGIDSAGRIVKAIAGTTADASGLNVIKIVGRLKTNVTVAAAADDVVMVDVPQPGALWHFVLGTGSSVQANATTLCDGTNYGLKWLGSASTHACGIQSGYIIDVAVTDTTAQFSMARLDQTRDGETCGAAYFKLLDASFYLAG